MKFSRMGAVALGVLTAALMGGSALAQPTASNTATAAALGVAVTENCSVGSGVQVVVSGVAASAEVALEVTAGNNDPGTVVTGGTTRSYQDAGPDGKVVFHPTVPSGAGAYAVYVNNAYTGRSGAFSVNCALGSPAVTKSGHTVKVVVRNNGDAAKVEVKTLTGSTARNRTVSVGRGVTATIYVVNVPSGKTAVSVASVGRPGSVLRIVG